MIYLTSEDFNGIISASAYASLKGDDDTNVNKAESLAISELSSLRAKFDIDTELSYSDDSRNAEMVRILTNVTVYYLYNSIADIEMPERVENNYSKELKDIRRMASGDQHCTLTRLKVDGKAVTNFRYGGDAKRSHDPFF